MGPEKFLAIVVMYAAAGACVCMRICAHVSVYTCLLSLTSNSDTATSENLEF